MTDAQTPPFRCRQGFTIIEVALAIAIIALGIVAIIGLLPTGLDVIRDASSTTQMANIAEDFITQYQQRALDSALYEGTTNVLPTSTFTTTVTTSESAIPYTVKVDVSNTVLPIITPSLTGTISRVAIQISYPGSRTNTFITEVARYVRP